MQKKKPKVNPNCPVSGCRTTKPHADDPTVKGFLVQFGPPEQMALWALASIQELRDSMCRDLEEKKVFAWFTRLRQPEEVYVRTLYALFVASEKELHHTLSGYMPNSYASLYVEVNKVVFEGRGVMLNNQPQLNSNPKDVLNHATHASYHAFMYCMGLVQNPSFLPTRDAWFTHLTKYCDYLKYMHGMFKAGKDKKDVLAGVINLHKPASHWAKAPATPQVISPKGSAPSTS